MRRSSLIGFIILNVLISLGVAFGVISLLRPSAAAERIPITVPVIVTATPDPNETRVVRIITATPRPGDPERIDTLPTGLFGTPEPTLDPVLLMLSGTPAEALTSIAEEGENGGSETASIASGTALPDQCIVHVVAEGDTPFGIAEQYGADGFHLMEVNGLDEATAAGLQIGDTLIVPLEGCPLESALPRPTETPFEEETEESALSETVTEESTSDGPTTAAPTVRPTLTLPPTATNASVSIETVLNAGDVTAEAVEIKNVGSTVNLEGWTITDAEGNVYTFAEQYMFQNASITVYTRPGTNTAVALYWGQDDPLWQPGDVVTLRNAREEVQSTFRIPRALDLP
jgi:hypothetical protein